MSHQDLPTPTERVRLRETAEYAAREAGRIQLARRPSTLAIERKGAADITTDVDLACEACIAAIVNECHPGHGILGEEGTRSEHQSQSPLVWIVDPLDGTKNYAHGYPRSCVSIAVAQNNSGACRVLLGVVFNPRTNEMFVAQEGAGATLNGQAICVSPIESLDRAMVASALTYQGRQADRTQLERLARVLGAAEAVRSGGCAALDLCDVACGRLDAYFEPGLHAWDTAAGALIVREAGGCVTTFDGTPHDPFGIETFASNGRVHQTLLALFVA